MSLGSTAYSSPNPFAPSFHTPRNLDDPLQFSLDEQRLNEWYKSHQDAGSTTIQKVQLRKEHKSPFHEFVMVLTKAGYYYRMERGRDREGTILDMMRENGVPPVDTIARLDLTSLEQLDGTSYCAIELCWGSDKTVDLKLVLDICFQIHNNSGKRYKLLTHNCYFFAQTIIMITVRKTVTCNLYKVLRDMFKSGIVWRETESAAKKVIAGKVLRLHPRQKVYSESRLGTQPNQPMKRWWIGLRLKRRQKRGQEQDWELQLRQRMRGGGVEEQLEPEPEWEQWERKWERKLKLKLERELERELERIWEAAAGTVEELRQ